MASLLTTPSPPLLLQTTPSSRPFGGSLSLRKRVSPQTLHSTVQQNDSPVAASTSDSVLSAEPQLPIEDTERVIPIGGCKACGRAEIEKGCNGEGRIQGGIATVPGFGWWPIKAFRPCPGFVASGGRYKRQGQSMDEVAFGKGKSEASVGASDDEVEGSKRRNPGRFRSFFNPLFLWMRARQRVGGALK
ncbi:uncharacterized protein LOC116260958 isoform X2 [Nymphaea colorata]|uniref:uncharacterized protein LOC116260958 isoform X2 n=1 Tax=Nymphaea colorata TaxID=210225 RepID=UPI00129EC8B4|nr:uncharacterized protein LOC116260958 isoform X2 [Nymphaea colorata]